MTKPEKTGEQVEAFFFKLLDGAPQYLVLKRVESRGGFWQPLTGGVHRGESLEECLRREAKEETGIESIVRIVDTGHKFEFEDHGRHHVEYIFGVEVPSETQAALSDEHEELRWLAYDEARAMLKWPDNIEGLRKLHTMLTA